MVARRTCARALKEPKPRHINQVVRGYIEERTEPVDEKVMPLGKPYGDECVPVHIQDAMQLGGFKALPSMPALGVLRTRFVNGWIRQCTQCTRTAPSALL